LRQLTGQADFERRFGGIRRLYGDTALQTFQSGHICVIGIGGVGSWAAEALARNAIGRITLIDLDNVAESNFNRQIHALEGQIGKPKVTAMAERIHLINPDCQVLQIEEFITPENVQELLGHVHYDGIIDAIDDAKAKAALAAWCRREKRLLVMAGGAGGRFDATRIKATDLANASGDRLLSKVRNLLRRDYGFPKGEKTKFSLPCIYSDEPITRPAQCEGVDDSLNGLSCAGYGSSVSVTATAGFAAAGCLLNALAKNAPDRA
jgi:tRNA A37 threonylcarbamoyladenosine dehydratase